MHEGEPMQKFLERGFWWLVGIFGSLISAGLISLIGVLWHMNGSIITLNDRVGNAIERLMRQEEQLADHATRITSLERNRKLPR